MGTSVVSGVGNLMEMFSSFPGTNNQVKPELRKMGLKQLLVFYQVIERGLAPMGAANPLVDGLSKEEKEEILQIGREMLEKAGLLNFNEKLKEFLK